MANSFVSDDTVDPPIALVDEDRQRLREELPKLLFFGDDDVLLAPSLR